MRPLRAITGLAFLAISAASGCAQTTTVGITGEPAPPLPAAPIKRSSMIVSGPGEALEWNMSPVLGDLDGDGFDDFELVAFEPLAHPAAAVKTAVYVFYGRPEFPEKLSTADADTVFRSSFGLSPLGDIDGDGFDDIAVHHHEHDTFEIIRGSRERLGGERVAHASGLVWRNEPSAAFSGLPPSTQAIRAAGDVNCDGRSDLLVTSMERDVVQDSLTVHANDTLLVLGSEQLPSGIWSSAWAVASFVGATGSEAHAEIVPRPAGDLDADGCDDLIADIGAATAGVYYGGVQRFTGMLTARDADALFEYAFGNVLPVTDLDGDGATDLVVTDQQRSADVVYGEAGRPIGPVQLTADFTLHYEKDDFHALDIGDISGDGFADVVVGAGMDARTDDHNARGAVYALRSSQERLSGVHALRDAELIMLGPEPSRGLFSEIDCPGLGSSMTVAGDVDGDGSRDILASAPCASERGAVFLIPSTPRAPD